LFLKSPVSRLIKSAQAMGEDILRVAPDPVIIAGGALPQIGAGASPALAGGFCQDPSFGGVRILAGYLYTVIRYGGVDKVPLDCSRWVLVMMVAGRYLGS